MSTATAFRSRLEWRRKPRCDALHLRRALFRPPGKGEAEASKVRQAAQQQKQPDDQVAVVDYSRSRQRGVGTRAFTVATSSGQTTTFSPSCHWMKTPWLAV
jgi:hypothetical protein